MTEKHSTLQSGEQSTRKPPHPCIPAWVREILPKLKGAPVAVLVAYWSRANKDGFAWPSIETLSRDTGYGELAVKRAKKVLIGIGLLVPVQQHRDTDGRYKKKVFRVCTEVSKASHGTGVCFSYPTAGYFSHPTVVSKAYQEGVPYEGYPKGRSSGSASPHRSAPAPIKGNSEKQEEKPYKPEVFYA
jgi:hypothetical protein